MLGSRRPWAGPKIPTSRPRIRPSPISSVATQIVPSTSSTTSLMSLGPKPLELSYTWASLAPNRTRPSPVLAQMKPNRSSMSEVTWLWGRPSRLSKWRMARVWAGSTACSNRNSHPRRTDLVTGWLALPPPMLAPIVLAIPPPGRASRA